MSDDRQAVLATAESLVAEAVGTLYDRIGRDATISIVRQICSAAVILQPLCGQHVTLGIIEQMATEQSAMIDHMRLVCERPPTEARH